MPYTLPPERTAHQRTWMQQYEPPLASNAPAYPRTWGRLMAGLMMAQPPRFMAEPDTTFTLSVDDLADLTETMVAEASAIGASYARPVLLDDVWVFELLPTNLVNAVWSNRRLESVTLFDWIDHPTKDNVVVVLQETWADELVVSEVWEMFSGVKAAKVTKLTVDGDPVASNRPGAEKVLGESDPMYNHPFHVQVLEADDTPRSIVPFVWSFVNGQPAPLHAGNEGALNGIIRLWDQEQTDAEMARNRIVMSEGMVPHNGVLGPRGEQLVPPGFNTDHTVLLLKAGMSAQTVADGKIDTVQFDDTLTQRKRIEGKVDSILEACGISPRSVGRSIEGGGSDSADAKRADQQMTTTTITGPARRWSATLGRIVTDTAGLNKKTDPGVLLFDGFRTTMGERAETVNTANLSDSMSARVRVSMLHPEWDDETVDGEVMALANEGLIDFVPERGGDDISPDQMAVLIQKMYLGVGVVLSAEEARDILNDAGAGLTGPPPVQPTVV